MPAITKQLISGIGMGHASNTNYCPLFGGQAIDTTEKYASGIVSTSGIIKNLRIKLSSAPGSTKQFDYTLYKNGAPTNLTVSISGTATSGFDFVNEVSIIAGDYLSLEIKPTGTPTVGIPTFIMDFVPTTAGETLLLANSGIILNNEFGSVIGGLASSIEFDTQLLIPCPGTIKNFYLRSDVAAGEGKTLTFTIRKNGVDTSLVVTLSGAEQKTNNNTANNFTVVPGDKISIQRTGDSTVTTNYMNTGLCFVPDTPGNFILGYIPGAEVMTNNTTQYTGVSYYGSWHATEANRRQIFSPCTLKNLYIELNQPPDNGAGTQAFIFTLRKGSSSQALTVTISETDTTGNATTDIGIADNALLDTMKTLTGTPVANTRALISYTGYIIPSTAIQVGDSTQTPPIPYEECTHNFVKTSLGKLVLFVRRTGGLQYKTSNDNGNTWDSSWTIIDTALPAIFDVIIDESNNIYVAWTTTAGAYLRKLTYSEGSWSIGDKKTILTSANLSYLSLIKRSTSELFVAFIYGTGTDRRLYGAFSNDDGDNWDNDNYLASVITFWAVGIIEKGSTIWGFIYNNNSELITYEWNDTTNTWEDPIIIASPGSISGLGLLKISDSEIYVATRPITAGVGGITVYKWNGSSWDEGTALTTNIYDYSPSIQNLAGKPLVLYGIKNADYTDNRIAYRKWNGSSWDSAVEIFDSKIVQSRAIKSIIYDVNYLYVNWFYGDSTPYIIYFDKFQLIIGATIQQEIFSDVYFKEQNQQTIPSNIYFVATQKNITSNVHFRGTVQKIRFSNVSFVEEVFYDINNKIRIAKQKLVDVVSDFRFVKRVLSDVNNIFVMVKAILKDIDNEFRMKKGKLYNINNDVRFIKSWQKAGDFGFQSLGKEYIKIFIAPPGEEINEETDLINDVNNDSIKIDKNINIAHIASFDLGRCYDSSKPVVESLVEIRYYQKNENDYWSLYKGYITEISPAENPESITIRCQNKYWLDNRTNKYFFVGHKPRDDREKYYSTINEAINAEFSLNLDIGNFVPQTIDCFAQGKSDILTSLISECGNYGWLYDVDDSFKLWKAGEGSIINIQRQEIGKNIGLYQLIEHQFNEDVSGVVNKLRVQMGEKVIRTFNDTGGNRQYTGYNYSSFQGFLTPAWNTSYERLAKYSIDGYGWDYPEPGKEKEFGEVFKKYNIPYLDPKLSSWSDRFPPRIEIHSPGGYYYAAIGTITEGFTIDYKNRIIIFNEPQYLYRLDYYGRMTAVRAPTLKLFLWKKNYYTFTENPEQNPEEDISNPLMFFTDKMGYYDITILKDLNLSSLSIQEGGTYVDENGEVQVIPSWDDTDFAKDYAKWQLSKTCDKKINGSILLTLDTVCFYNIDLSKRIYISGITEEPMNVISMSYNVNSFTVNIELQNSRGYKRTVSLQSRGE